MIRKVCPECGGITKLKQIPPRGWALKVPGKYLMNVHAADGTPLCPVMGRDTDGNTSYVPALPVRRKL